MLLRIQPEMISPKRSNAVYVFLCLCKVCQCVRRYTQEKADTLDTICRDQSLRLIGKTRFAGKQRFIAADRALSHADWIHLDMHP